ncbi:hypothetical protein E2C01_024426 [Portunus trituberculatus]|uniref:Uncharacterized protein n=1 Tax=Portunus trituberculatus TaxID=210409 RepID=A0A5B7ECS9_PORTR|nr:hypothetical protein [Portunus trituberculatus]
MITKTPVTEKESRVWRGSGCGSVSKKGSGPRIVGVIGARALITEPASGGKGAGGRAAGEGGRAVKTRPRR